MEDTYSLSYDKKHIKSQQTITAFCGYAMDIAVNNYINQENMIFYIMSLYQNPLNIEQVKYYFIKKELMVLVETPNIDHLLMV